jgi:delta 1-pyrroline-5-carboxylate dehydrogenase
MPNLFFFFFFFFFKAGIPDGVLNVVTGFGSTAGAAISSHMDIDAVISSIYFDICLIHVNLLRKSSVHFICLHLLWNILVL